MTPTLMKTAVPTSTKVIIPLAHDIMTLCQILTKIHRQVQTLRGQESGRSGSDQTPSLHPRDLPRTDAANHAVQIYSCSTTMLQKLRHGYIGDQRWSI